MSMVPAFIESLLRASLLIVISGAILTVLIRLLQPRAAGIHRAGWLAVLATGLLVTPLTIELPWLDAAPADTRLADLPAAAMSAEPAIATATRSEPARTDSRPAVSVMPSAESQPAVSRSVAASRDGTVEQPMPVGALPSGQADESRRLQPPWAARAVFLFWLAGLLGLAAAALASWMLLVVALRQAHPASERFQREVDRIARERSLPGSVRLFVHESIGPLLCLTPRGYRIIVPEDTWTGLTAAQRQAVLRHELAHRCRHDVVKSLLVRVLALPHWFNPMAWRAARCFDEAAEWACDESMADRPDQVAALAGALLQFAERRTRTSLLVGVSAVQGRSLTGRIRRLLHNPYLHSREPLMKRFLILLVMAGVVAAGAVRFHLVARTQEDTFDTAEEPAEPQTLQDWQQTADMLAERIDTSGSRLAAAFRTALQSEPGLIVLQDRVGQLAEEEREAAQANLLDEFLAAHFERSGDGWILRDDQRDYRDRIVKDSQAIDADLEKMMRVFRRKAVRLTGSSDTVGLLKRFATSEAGPVMLYREMVQGLVRPDAETVLQETNGVFVMRSDGTVTVHPARRQEAQRLLEAMKQGAQAEDFVREELQDWIRSLSVPDDLHRLVRETVNDPLFPIFVIAQIVEEDAEPAQFRRGLDDFFQDLEYLLVDTADGLVLNPEMREELEYRILEFRQLARTAAALENAVAELADRFSDDTPLDAGWKKLLSSSDLPRLRLAAYFGAAGLDAADAVEQLLAEVLEEDENGRLTVRADRADELQNQIRDLLQEFRVFRRRARVVNRQTDKIRDDELSAAFRTWGGRLLLRAEFEQYLRRFEHSGLEAWVDEHFEEQNGRLVLRPDAEESIAEFLADVEAVREELENDDFQRTDDGDSDESDRESD